jgi:hypothetical protein
VHDNNSDVPVWPVNAARSAEVIAPESVIAAESVIAPESVIAAESVIAPLGRGYVRWEGALTASAAGICLAAVAETVMPSAEAAEATADQAHATAAVAACRACLAGAAASAAGAAAVGVANETVFQSTEHRYEISIS